MKAQVLRVSPVYMLFLCNKALVCASRGDIVFRGGFEQTTALGDALSSCSSEGYLDIPLLPFGLSSPVTSQHVLACAAA